MPGRFERQCKTNSAFIPWNAHIGKGAYFGHDFNGIHIAIDAVVGDRCTFMHNVTIGQNTTSDQAAPVVGNDVFLGPGCAIIGRCHIGDGAKIGANVVLVNVDIAAGSVIVNKSAYSLTDHKFIYPQD